MSSRLSGMFRLAGKLIRTHPLPRGMLTYSVTWSVGSLIQQTFDTKEYNLPRALKFGLFGSCYVAPTLFGWMKLSCMLWPKPVLIHSMTKVKYDRNICSIFQKKTECSVIEFTFNFRLRSSKQRIPLSRSVHSSLS